MTQNKKDLLLKDLCARLTCELKVLYKGGKYKMKTFRELKRDDIIIYKNFKVFEECDDIINGVHYSEKYTLVDVNCVVECVDDLREITYDPNDKKEKFIQIQIYNPLNKPTFAPSFFPNTVHQLIAIPVSDLDKSENDKFKII